jgi:hypothetical protein
MPLRRSPVEQPVEKPRIAVFSGPTATVMNSFPLVTGDRAAAKYGLDPILGEDGRHLRFDVLRAQRLAAPVRVYVEQFSGHPLEADAAELYAPPDGYVGPDGSFRPERRSEADVPVYEVELRPEDGLYLLPYMGRQRDGRPWDSESAFPGAPADQSRQPYYPDASRLFEEIDRFDLDIEGLGSQLSRRAEFDFYRPAPSGGYTKGLAAGRRSDVGEGDIPPERLGEDFFPYRPRHLRREPPTARLAHLTNEVQRVLATGRYAGGIWLDGSPFVEEAAYWLNLLVDTSLPIACTQGDIGELSHRNIIDCVEYICSRVWAGPDGRDTIGVVAVIDEVIYSSREVQKGDARPGGFVATGGHGGIVGTIGKPGRPVITFRPARQHTAGSSVRIGELPAAVTGVRAGATGAGEAVNVPVVDGGQLRGDAIPKVTIINFARFDDGAADGSTEVEILARIEENLRSHPLAGFIAVGGNPYGYVGPSRDAAFRQAILRGMPVVHVLRGNAEGFGQALFAKQTIAGGNLTATKARLLLMACLLRFGSLPPAADPDNPTAAEIAAIDAALARFQAVFDTH